MRGGGEAADEDAAKLGRKSEQNRTATSNADDTFIAVLWTFRSKKASLV